MKSIYENTGKGNTQQGDYVLPNIEIENKAEYQIGVWGQRYRKYLKENHKVLYYNFLTSGTLYQHISEVETQAENLFASVIRIKRNGVAPFYRTTPYSLTFYKETSL